LKEVIVWTWKGPDLTDKELTYLIFERDWCPNVKAIVIAPER